MKKIILAIAITAFGASAVGAAPMPYQYEQRKDDKKKDPPGPPVVKEKGKDDKPKDPPPKKDRKPE